MYDQLGKHVDGYVRAVKQAVVIVLVLAVLVGVGVGMLL